MAQNELLLNFTPLAGFMKHRGTGNYFFKDKTFQILIRLCLSVPSSLTRLALTSSEKNDILSFVADVKSLLMNVIIFIGEINVLTT